MILCWELFGLVDPLFNSSSVAFSLPGFVVTVFLHLSTLIFETNSLRCEIHINLMNCL